MIPLDGLALGHSNQSQFAHDSRGGSRLSPNPMDSGHSVPVFKHFAAVKPHGRRLQPAIQEDVAEKCIAPRAEKHQPQAGFSSLPFDLHCRILALLDAMDILVMRQTCQALACATRQRTVWTAALSSLCERDTIFLPTFPIADMTLHELELAVSSPSRFSMSLARMARRAPQGRQFSSHGARAGPETGQIWVRKPLESHRTFSLALPGTDRERWTELLSTGAAQPRVYLVPGGRYLFFFVPNHLSLWDLGVPCKGRRDHSRSKETNATRLVAVLQEEIDSFTVHMGTDGSSLRVMGKKYDPGFRGIKTVYEIYPTSDAPTFRMIGAPVDYNSNYAPTFTTGCGNLFTFVHGPVIKISNYVSDEWSTFRVAMEDEIIHQILMTSTHIFLIHRAFVSVYSIPAFKRGAQAQALLPEPSEAMSPLARLPLFGRSQEATLPQPSWYEDSDVECLGLCDWYTGSQQPLWFDMVDMAESGLNHGSVSGRRVQVESFCVDMDGISVGKPEQDPGWSMSTHGRSLSFELESIRDYAPAPHRTSNGNQVRLWSSYNGIYYHAVLPRTPNLYSTSRETQPGDSAVFCLTRAPNTWWTHYGFCPFVGRLCYVLPREEWNIAEGELPVKVVDYLGAECGALSRQRSSKWKAARKAFSVFNQ